MVNAFCHSYCRNLTFNKIGFALTCVTPLYLGVLT